MPRSAADIQADLDEHRAARSAILSGRVAEFGEGSHRARLLSLGELNAEIRRLEHELAYASTSVLLPIREVDV